MDKNFAAMGIPVATALAARAPRATSRALVSSAATQYKSTHASIHSACASKSVTMLTTTRHGEAFSATDYARWFEAAGLRAAGMHPNAGMPTTFLFADKA